MKTDGLSPKVPTQAIVAVLSFVIAYFGIELTPEVAGAVATVLGIIGGVAANPGSVRPG